MYKEQRLKQAPSAPSRFSITAALTLALIAAGTIAPDLSGRAEAATAHASRALRIAASKKGSPYEWGAAGPDRFDCSGLTLFSYRKAGKPLPRTAASQYHRTRRVSESHRKEGDLVFFHSRGNIYHVGIYAGGGRIWHSPKSGSVVRLEPIWSSNVYYGRVH
ncbi:C40 family peptidase [Streptomyces sp. NPDC006879]|uniref:C40 family peptidase n=1 Tax=Streptomyces sp. NPDC006879 TaxID=3364767 RepID=UPI0036A4B6A0